MAAFAIWFFLVPGFTPTFIRRDYFNMLFFYVKQEMWKETLNRTRSQFGNGFRIFPNVIRIVMQKARRQARQNALFHENLRIRSREVWKEMQWTVWSPRMRNVPYSLSNSYIWYLSLTVFTISISGSATICVKEKKFVEKNSSLLLLWYAWW